MNLPSDNLVNNTSIWLLIRLYVCLKSKMPASFTFKAMSRPHWRNLLADCRTLLRGKSAKAFAISLEVHPGWDSMNF
ncbi:hypothetical protein KGK69_000383 [Salmonella enterica]|nr:hypothetical protein [Salmonella enterica]